MSDHDTPAVQIAVLKTQLGHAIDDVRDLAAEMKAERIEFRQAVDDLRNEMTRYKGFVGGIAFVLSGVVAALGLAIGAFKGWLWGR